MKRINLFGTQQQPATHEERQQQKRDEVRGPSSGSDAAWLKQRMRSGKASFLKLLKGVSKNSARVQPEQTGGQSGKHLRPHIGGQTRTERDLPPTPTRKDPVRRDHRTIDPETGRHKTLTGIRSNPVPVDDHGFNASEFVPATVFGEKRRTPDSANSMRSTVPQSPVPVGDVGFNMSDLVPATVFKPHRRNSAIGLDDDIEAERIGLSKAFSDTREIHSAGRPYVPVKLKTYASGGAQDKSAVAYTDYARQAAEMLIENGELNTRHAASMMIDAGEDPNLPAHFRAHVIRTLQNLEGDPELAAIVNGTCANGPPTGPAADAVRATLNLDPGVPVTEADARKALVMALLGDLRQRTVADCFAIATATCLHADSPMVVASHMKEMLEHNRLSFTHGGVTTQVPFNRYFNKAGVQTPLAVKADGTCRGKAADGGNEAAYDLYKTPGMHAALKALGVPEAEMQYEVGAALWQMGIQDEHDHEVTCQQVIEKIARGRSGAANPDKLIASALHAFTAQETVGLLRAWEFTLAAAGAENNGKTQADTMVSRLLYGAPAPGEPRLQSLSHATQAFLQHLESKRKFPNVPLDEIRDKLMVEIEKQMHQRFCRLFDPDAEWDAISQDGVTKRGGWVLYDRTPADNPGKWLRIDTAEKFQNAMAELVDEACERTSRKIGRFADDGLRTDTAAKREGEALRNVADNLIDHIHSDAFIKHAESNFTNGSSPSSEGPGGILWRGVAGGSTGDVAAYCGSKLIAWKRASTEPGKDAALEVVQFLGGGLTKMAAQLQAKRNESHAEFRVPVSNGIHGFTLLPQAMEDVWLRGATPDQWIDNTLVKPAAKYYNESRSEPWLMDVLLRIAEQTGMERKEIPQLYQHVAGHAPRLRNLQQPYSLSDLHEALKEQCRTKPGGSQTLADAEAALTAMFPLPKSRPIADINWAGADGGPCYLGFRYNPFNDRIEMHSMNADGSNAQIRNGNWLEGVWRLFSPLPTHVA